MLLQELCLWRPPLPAPDPLLSCSLWGPLCLASRLDGVVKVRGTSLAECPLYEPLACLGGELVPGLDAQGCPQPVCRCPDGSLAVAGVCPVDCTVSAEVRCCATDDGCACGTNTVTGACDYGNPACIDTSRQCPDFRTGIHGRFVMTCVAGVCQQNLQ